MGPVTDVIEQLGWRDHLEVRSCATQGNRRPVQRVRRHPKQAVAFVDVLDGAPRADLGADDCRWGMDQRLDTVRRGQVLDPGTHEHGGVAGGHLAWAESGSGAYWSVEAVETETTPVVAGKVPGDEVPAASEKDESVW